MKKNELLYENKINDLKFNIEELKLEIKNLEEKIEKKNFYLKLFCLF